MQYTWDNFQLAFDALYLLPVIAAIGVIAFATRCRATFVVGCIGALLGWLLTSALDIRRWGTGGGIDNLFMGAESVRENSAILAVVALGFLALIRGLKRWERNH